MGPTMLPLLALGSSLTSAFGQFQAAQYQSFRAKQDAKIARIQGDQIDVAHRDELKSTLANIAVIRAATGVGTDSPTSLALRDENIRISDRNRTRDVTNRRLAASQAEQDAKFYRMSANIGLLGGVGKSLVKFQQAS